MIPVPALIWDDLIEGHIRRGGIKVVLDFAADGQSITLDPANTVVSTVTSRIGVLPTGWRKQTCTVSHFDETGYWHPFKNGYFLDRLAYANAFGSGACKVTITQELIARDGTTFDLPVLVGRVLSTEHENEQEIEFVCQDELSFIGSAPTKVEHYIGRTFSIIGQSDNYIISHGYGGTTPSWFGDMVNSDNYKLLNGTGFEMEWFGIGSVRQGTSVLRGYNAILASQLCQPVWREDGTMRFVHLWPFDMGSYSEDKPELPYTITDNQAFIGDLFRSDWPTRLSVKYQGTKMFIVDQARETGGASLEAEINMAFIQGGRQAVTALAMLARQADLLTEQLQIGGPGLPSVAQLGDYVTVDYRGTIGTYRVVEKRWTMTNTTLGMIEASTDLGYREATYALWESSDWSTTDLVL